MRQTLEEPTRYLSSPGFLVAQRFNQSMLTGASNVIQFDTSLINDNGCFSFSTFNYTCPKAGRMFFSGQLYMQNTGGSNGDFYLFCKVVPSSLKGNAINGGRRVLTPGDFQPLNFSAVVDVSFGTVITLETLNFGTSMSTFNTSFGEETTYFSGFYLP